ncbi:hypothetical protein Q4543_09745 [Salipiger sp. 1_MG-2023]|uniref:hypothetical protein n=1 Tax=Salipiger sp. 1_MG-2023 TaxID=3062665 RepID=UPI0026E38D91|nr:hypothetical protein [Salipiger sp. 1_MG-2023]MDO6585804.1 hypothetical protein [Salipiger sp. 1_MG-2023]
MRTSAALAVLLSLAGSLCAAQGRPGAPMSAIGWLGSDNVPTVMPAPAPMIPLKEPPTASSGASPEVETLPLGAPSPGAAGLLPMSVTGLPRSLWGSSETGTLSSLLAAVDPSEPALSALLFTLLLAEADAPVAADGGARFLASRLDRLLAEGAIDPALALIEQAGQIETPILFERWFDLALLAGRDDAPCAALQDQPELSDDLPTRIYCAARRGDWDHAATVLGTAQALGQLSERDGELLLRFLEPELAEGSPPVPVPPRPTPLQFRLFEAIGEALPTQPLPRAFAATELSGTSGWRAQLLAAERLARRGALSENRLLGIYSDRKPAASGGVWDRVSAVQKLDAALATGRSDLVGPALVKAWPQMRSAGLLVPFAKLFGPRLAELTLSGRAATLATRAELLSDAYEPAAQKLAAPKGLMATVAAVAQGEPPAFVPDGGTQGAVARAWSGATPPEALRNMLAEGRLGEVILRAMALLSSGAEGNHEDLTEALATLRAVGLEDTARRAAIQLLILSDEGAPR